MTELEILTNQLILLREQNELMKQQNMTLKEILAFWSRIVSDDYFNEMIKNDGIRFPK